MPKRKTGSQNGFTLVEVLVALALLAITGVALLSLLSASTRLRGDTNLRETARNLATAQLEYIKNQPYNEAGIYDVQAFTTQYPGLTTDDPPAVSIDESGVQKILISVRQDSNLLATLEGYKVDW
jgi:prepilin-type N-terminal cleavage/methylation domain-containing protein